MSPTVDLTVRAIKVEGKRIQLNNIAYIAEISETYIKVVYCAMGGDEGYEQWVDIKGTAAKQFLEMYDIVMRSIEWTEEE